MKKILVMLALVGLVAAPAAAGLIQNSPSIYAVKTQTVGASYATTDSPRALVTVDIGGLLSMDEYGSANNVVLTIDLAAATGLGTNLHVDGIGWDNVLSTNGASWLSEATIAFEDTAQTAGVFLTPGNGDDMSGTSVAYSSGGVLPLADYGLDFYVTDGQLRIELFEAYDDVTGAADATWNSGTLTISATPEPATLALLGFGALALLRRR
jgi:hypothetical protein